MISFGFSTCTQSRLRHALTVLLGAACCVAATAQADDLLGALAAPQQGRSMRASSTFRQGPDGKYDPKADPKSDLEERSNSDNFQVAPGKTHVLMDVKGPGVIT